MKLLLDTNALIRWHAGTLAAPAVKVVQRADVVVVSAVSAWEIAIKQALGKLRFPDDVEDVVERYGFASLSASVRHGDLLRTLPRHHPDPFDRMLIVQALDEGLTILTSDRAFEAYRVPVAWA
ncbi:MAG TPA: type II toxin-antitoxin system VapC family toxin [Gemmatimonadaceae bacterium]